MYKISLDHLERLFGYIWQRGGTYDIPSAYDFCHLFRKIIVLKQLLGLGYGKDIPCEEK